MPYETKKTTSQCPASKPFGVFNKDSGKLHGCHPSRAKALAQMRALYAAESGAKMNSEQIMVIPTKSFAETAWLDGNKKWIKIYPYTSWSHPIFTDTSIDQETASALKDSFEKKVYGDQDLVVTYDHGMDRAKGGKAAGWYRGLDVKDDGLWGLVEFTDEARKEIDAGEWRYFSGEHHDEWENPHTGETHNLVFAGGAITNKPWVKDGCVPLNFSEVYVEAAELPEPTVEAQSEVHMAEENTEGVETPTNDESADVEHSEPGTQGQPRTDERNDDDSADSGSRRDTPPVAQPNDVDARLREVLGLDPDADIIKAVTDMKAEVEPLREAGKAHSERKAFSEQYPEQAKQLEDLQKRDRENRAKQFSESFANIADKDGKPTGKGYPAIVLDKLEEVHKRFSEGNVNINDLTDVLDLVAQTGTVDYTEHGTSRSVREVETEGAPKAFAEKIVEIQEADKLDYGKATLVAAERHPELYEGYRKHVELQARR